MLREGQVLFTFLHLVADRDQAQDSLASGATCITYETVTDDACRLPLVTPMPQVSRRLSVQAGGKALEISGGGKGVLLSGVPVTAQTYVVGDVIYYCVANMPGAVPRTSTYALNNVTLPWIIRLCGDGVKSVIQHDVDLTNSLDVYNGRLTNKGASEDLGL